MKYCNRFSYNTFKKKNSVSVIYSIEERVKINKINLFIDNVLNKKNSFIFESVEKAKNRGRYTIFGFNPDLILEVKKNNIYLNKRKIKNKQNPKNYLEKFINYDKTDYRVDIVDGQFVGCYGRSAPVDDWKTNITSGGSIILREPNDEIIDLALKAAKVTGLEIAGVDLLFDLDTQEYVVLEVNGIPAFATPEQEQLGLKFNPLKVEKIVNLIERTVEENL